MNSVDSLFQQWQMGAGKVPGSARRRPDWTLKPTTVPFSALGTVRRPNQDGFVRRGEYEARFGSTVAWTW
jgi:hypothetical protein